MKEIWKPICETYQNCELNQWYSRKVYHIRQDKYEISNTGKVRNMITGQELAIDKQGRVTLDISDWKYYEHWARCIFPVQRLVYLTFNGKLSSTDRVYKKK